MLNFPHYPWLKYRGTVTKSSSNQGEYISLKNSEIRASDRPELSNCYI